MVLRVTPELEGWAKEQMVSENGIFWDFAQQGMKLEIDYYLYNPNEWYIKGITS